ncbi:hypothetical protein, partial [Rhodoblastus sp.]|uniref:hypothetical protein n=1 Tax=Rhodoblastus sp. TaxID=1962975 RepID=UPI003F992C9B
MKNAIGHCEIRCNHWRISLQPLVVPRVLAGCRQRQTGENAPAADKHRAGATLSMVATLFRADESCASARAAGSAEAR